VLPTPFRLRQISTGVHAIRKPTNGRRFYLACELATALGVHESSVSRWIKCGYIAAEKSVAGFMLIAVDEAMRFSREGPPRGTEMPLAGAAAVRAKRQREGASP
jgi:hypothetical protein